MKKKGMENLEALAILEKQFDALYREAGSRFGLPECSMWILYFLSSGDEPITQQDLIGKMKYPKQTINSSVMKMENEGLLKLRIIPGTRNRKTLLLTETGTTLAKETVGRLLTAELAAVRAMGKEDITQFIGLYHAFFTQLELSFRQEGLIDA